MQKAQLQALIKEFNQAETILVISKFPYQNIGESFHGVAVYTEETLSALVRETQQKFVVLVEQQYDRPAELLAEGRILLLPVFQKHSLRVFPELWRTLRQFDQIRQIQLHSEFYNSGDLVQMTLLLPFLYFLRLRGKVVSFVAHNVVHDFAFLSNHVGRTLTLQRLSLLAKLIPWYYRFLSFGVKQFIVLDESIKVRLSDYLRQPSKVRLTNIWLQKKQIRSKSRQNTRKTLGYQSGDVVLAVFGFVNRYKGIDLLLKNFLRFKQAHPDKRYKLLLAGGMAPSQRNQSDYQKYYRQIERLASQHSDITLTGFIPAKQISGYIAASDVVLLPYRGILGASASWATVLRYAKPCFFSTALVPYMAATDVKQALQQSDIVESDLFFATNYLAFEKFLLKLWQNQELINRAAAFSKALRALRTEKTAIARDFLPLFWPSVHPKIGQTCYNLNDAEITA